MTTPEAQRQRTRIALGAAALAVMFSMATAGFALIQRFDATNAARHNNARVWHAVICSIEQQVLKEQKLSTTRRREVLGFYDSLLVNNVKTVPCGLIQSLGR